MADDSGVKALCDLLGKLRQMSQSQKIEIVKQTIHLPVTMPDINSREEIVGIRLGKDIEHVLPSELALLSDPDTELLFDLKFVESRLMCFEMQGVQHSSREIEVEAEQQVSEEDEQGPVIICIDTSGSMHGMPENIAKAVTLFIATRAKEQQRDCYLINFSTAIESLDLSGGYTLKTLLTFLHRSFHGGTDVTPAIEHGLDVMTQDEYQNADMLIISDFVMSDLPKNTLAAIDDHRGNGSRFYSLCIGDQFMTERLEMLFDREWIFNPRKSSILELKKFQESLL